MAGNRASALKAAQTKARNMRDSEGFTEAEHRFVLHYMGAANRVAAEAYKLSHPGTKGTRQSQYEGGSRLMRRPHIIHAIEQMTIARAERLKITADDVLRDIVILKTDAERLPKDIPSMKLRREIIKDIGEHVNVGAFRRNVGLSAPNGGPIETADLAALASLTDEELDQLERARTIMDRIAGNRGSISDGGGDQGGEGTSPPSA